jgi:hypothetical protein
MERPGFDCCKSGDKDKKQKKKGKDFGHKKKT